MRVLLLTFLASTVAHAATLDVPSAQNPTIAAAVAAASGGDTIRLLPPPPDNPGFVHRIESQIIINKNLTIRADFPPREVRDQDIQDDVIVYLDPESAATSNNFDAAFKIRANRTLTFQNIRFKQPESICDDRLDNDGNGLVDADDPVCEGVVVPDDTAVAPPIITADSNIVNTRAFYVEPDGGLRVRDCEFQGWSFAVEGNVVYADNADDIEITGSRFISNLGLLEVTENGDYSRSRGIIYIRGTTLDLSGNTFDTNEHRYGGAVFATDGSVVIADDNVFLRNKAEDGGAIFVESSTLDASRNFFVGNEATVVPALRLFVTYEGGAIYAEDSAVTLKNNVFLQNASLDWAAAVLIRRNFLGTALPVIENNTFVENIPNLAGGASVVIDETTFRYVNNISYGEIAGVIGAQNQQTGLIPTVRYNDIFGVSLDNIFVAGLAGLAIDQNTNVFGDPLFYFYAPRSDHLDWRLWRFWVRPASPAIDSGDPTITDVGGGPSDMGAYGGALSGTTDEDNDGWPNIYDCNDNDPAVNPAAYDSCDDSLDNDCNGIVNDNEEVWYVDADIDGFGDINGQIQRLCPEQVGQLPRLQVGVWTTNGGDCDDTNSLKNPGRVEFCDEIDNDCDGRIDEDIVARPHYEDLDLDGFGNPDPRVFINVDCPPEGFSPFASDCNDGDPTIHPLITTNARTHLPLANATLERHEADRDLRFVADGIDQDCDFVDLCYPDFDRDGFGAAPPPGVPPTYVSDNDRNCRNLSAFTAANATDCDDGDPASFPGGTEVPGDGLDQNCDGHDDCYEDLDGDGFGSENVVADDDLFCDNASSPTSSNNLDCDDSAQIGAELNPTQPEICDGFDNNCDGTIDEVTGPNATDFYQDLDGDGFGDLRVRIKACGEPVGYSRQPGDCDDEQPRTYPGNTEVCDGIDNNCEAGIDEDAAVDVRKWYEDLDGDGYGNPDLFVESCDAPEEGNYVVSGRPLDCDDSQPTVGPCACAGCSGTGAKGGLPLALALVSMAMVRRRRED